MGFKRNKCWCCSVIFVKKKQIKKREGIRKKNREREKRPKEYTKRSRDSIFYGISMSIKKKKYTKNTKKEWKATRREIA